MTDEIRSSDAGVESTFYEPDLVDILHILEFSLGLVLGLVYDPRKFRL